MFGNQFSLVVLINSTMSHHVERWTYHFQKVVWSCILRFRTLVAQCNRVLPHPLCRAVGLDTYGNRFLYSLVKEVLYHGLARQHFLYRSIQCGYPAQTVPRVPSCVRTTTEVEQLPRESTRRVVRVTKS